MHVIGNIALNISDWVLSRKLSQKLHNIPVDECAKHNASLINISKKLDRFASAMGVNRIS